ncbi:MAG: 16S rRNA (adenine(1518)-N(6)/adenine(1519)-N(6))-dimethyltransferase RsmA [Candidatus Paceibacteria bacterium]
MIKKPKKSLGQNFLISQSVVDKIIETANLAQEDIVLEVGPGKGILTQALLEKAGKVISVEKDDELILFLKEEFSEEIENGKLILIHGDILTFDFENLGKRSFLEEERNGVERRKRCDLGERFCYKIVANIPYYITGEFLRKMLSLDIQPTQMVLLVQKEVAQRIAREKKESVLSISVKAYGEPKYIQTVKRGSFAPAPKVDSAILSINNISKSFFITANKKGYPFHEKGSPFYDSEKRFFEVVKAGFAHKRKFLLSNLEKSQLGRWTSKLLLSKEELKKAFFKAGIDEKARAEDISLEQWKQFVQEI